MKLTAVMDPINPYSAELFQFDTELYLSRMHESEKNNISFRISRNQSFVSFIGRATILYAHKNAWNQIRTIILESKDILSPNINRQTKKVLRRTLTKLYHLARLVSFIPSKISLNTYIHFLFNLF